MFCFEKQKREVESSGATKGNIAYDSFFIRP